MDITRLLVTPEDTEKFIRQVLTAAVDGGADNAAASDIFIVAGAADYERGCSEKKPFSEFFHGIGWFCFLEKSGGMQAHGVFHAAAVN